MRIAVAAVLVALSACQPGASAPASSPPGMPTNLVLRSYDVPKDAAPQVRSVLRELMWFGSDGKDSSKYVGRAEVGVDGRLVVLASEGVQEGVKGLIASLGARPPTPCRRSSRRWW